MIVWHGPQVTQHANLRENLALRTEVWRRPLALPIPIECMAEQDGTLGRPMGWVQ